MTVDTRPSLPAALASLKEQAQSLGAESRSFCTLHGPQSGLNCQACDEHFPEQVKAREIGGPGGIAVGFTKDEVQKMVADAVTQAMRERDAFEAWKNSPEGQAAAAVAQTAGHVTPDHATPDPNEGQSGA